MEVSISRNIPLEAVNADGIRFVAQDNADLQAIVDNSDRLREERNAAIELAVEWADRFAQLISRIDHICAVPVPHKPRRQRRMTADEMFREIESTEPAEDEAAEAETQ